MAPIRDLLAEHSRVLGAPGQGLLSRVDHALSFVNRMMETKPRYLQANPTAATRLQQIGELDRNYLAHEYFNDYWQPVSFSAIRPVLSAAKLEFAGSATYPDHVPALKLTPEQLEFLAQIPDATFRENTCDFLVNRQFRQDYWIRGARRLSAHEQGSALRAVRLMLVAPREQITMKVLGMLGEADMDASIHGPLLDLLGDYQPHSLGELQQRLPAHIGELRALLQMVLVLAHKSCVSPVQDDTAIALARTDLAVLASPVTGGRHRCVAFATAVPAGPPGRPSDAGRLGQLHLQAFRAPQQTMVRNGTVLTTDEDNLAEITLHAESFRDNGLPILQALGVAQ